MSETESKKNEVEIERLKDEELEVVAGGYGLVQSIIDIFDDKCTRENPERKYNALLCSRCSNSQQMYNNYTKVKDYYCGKVQKIIHTEKVV